MNRMFRNYMVFLAVVFCMMLSCGPVSYGAEEKSVIRVGFPTQSGLTMKDDNGNYTGYTYDYLKEIAQYTGWTYEFVEAEGSMDQQLVQLMDMLEKGELDLLGAMNNNEQTSAVFDFPSENYGNAYSVIAVRGDDDRIDEYNLSDFKGLRIALFKRANYHNGKFYQYAKLNGIQYEPVWCQEDGKQAELVLSGQADVMLSVDVSLPQGFRPVAKFSPTPFYFATTKGNTHIINELNRAISYISETNPTLQMNLYNKYFSRSSSQLFLNAMERKYIQEHPVLKVLVHDGFGPIQYYDEEGKIQGVDRDLLSSIAQKAGWELEYVYADDYDAFEQALNHGEADVVLSILYDYDTVQKREALLSNPYLETESVLVAHEGVDMLNLNGKVQAVYKGTRKSEDKTDNVRLYDSLEESLDAVEKGECDYTYSNSYTASYYQSRNQYEHVVVYPQASGDSVKYSIGILRKDDKQILAILNKGIRSIETGELEQYIYNNAQRAQKVTFRTFIRDNSVPFMLFTLLAASGLLTLIYTHYRSQMRMKKQIELENTRYRYLSDILKEVTFTYDYGGDILTLSREGVEIFGTAESIQQYSRYQSSSIEGEGLPSLYHLLEQRQDVDAEILIMLPDRGPEWYRAVIKVIFDGNQADSAIGRLQNIHGEKLERERLEHRSKRDGLTGIYNIAAAKKEITQMMDQHTHALALAVIDLDGFKEINDRYGHYTGDQVLIHTAEALNETFCDGAVTARLGGDEFIACIPYTGNGPLTERCNALFESLQARCRAAGHPVITVSMGISISRKEDDYTSLYQRADAVLYEIKKSGKNSYRIEAEAHRDSYPGMEQEHHTVQ
jgi:diguanylate cyclase (GGDEF)-like protein